jgi:predicted TIM-barrel fold metal-dependent hydrolase
VLPQDRQLALACVHAYNDFVLDEWCAYAPDRQIPLGILPLWDVDRCVEEIERTAAGGMRAFSFPENPAPHGLPSLFDEAWDPMWSALEAAEMPVCMHIGTSGSMPKPTADAPYIVGSALLPINTWATLASLLFSPVFHRHSGLQVSLTEGGVGWIPAALERADYIWDIHRYRLPEIEQGLRPTELFRRNVSGCLLEDRIGIELRHEIGVDRISFESDYPHADSKWPNARKYASELLVEVPDDEAHQMIELNARRLFRFPRSDA